MTLEITLVLGLVALAIILFTSEKLPLAFTSLIVLTLLLVTGLVSPEEGLSGFSNPATVTVAAMFVLSSGLQRVGALTGIARALQHTDRSPRTFLFVVMLLVGALSAFVNNTAAVAVLLPVVLTACSQRNITASKVLIPLSYAAQFGGVCTLIGTSTNLLVNAVAVSAGLPSFEVFEFAKLGIMLSLVGFVYFLLFEKWVLPERPSTNLAQTYRLAKYFAEMRVLDGSPLIGRTVLESRLRDNAGLTIIEIIRDAKKIWMPLNEPLQPGDLLLAECDFQHLPKLQEDLKLQIASDETDADKRLFSRADVSVLETMIAPRSRLIGRTLKGVNFRGLYNAVVLALRRREKAILTRLNDVRLQLGDSLLLQMPRKDIPLFNRDEDFIILERVELPQFSRSKSTIAIAIMMASIGLAAFGVLPILNAALLGCIAMVLTQCLRFDDAYRAIDWRVIFLLAGTLPLGLAMQKTGAAHLIVDHSLRLVAPLGSYGALAMIYFLTAALTACMSNNATAVLVAPIAISTASALGVDPKPFLMAVCFGASTCFITPVGYQTNTMVFNPGGYRFTDFIKAGMPLNLMFGIISTIFIPVFWPF